MAWIESHQELARHPKTKRLARAAGISIPAAIGHLHLLWWWALDYAQDGSLHGFTPEDIADGMEWDGEDANGFVEALINAGFLDQEDDGTLSIHDWHDYAGRLINQRKAQAEYKQRQYSLYNDLRLTRAVKKRDGDICQYCGKTVNWNDRRGADGGTYDHVDPDGGNELDNIVVSCRSCKSKKGKRTPREAQMPLITGNYTVDNRQVYGKNTVDISTITVPNPTVPNHTVPNSTVPNSTVHNSTVPYPTQPEHMDAEQEQGANEQTNDEPQTCWFAKNRHCKIGKFNEITQGMSAMLARPLTQVEQSTIKEVLVKFCKTMLERQWCKYPQDCFQLADVVIRNFQNAVVRESTKGKSIRRADRLFMKIMDTEFRFRSDYFAAQSKQAR
jgi:hypothetical protein